MIGVPLLECSIISLPTIRIHVVFAIFQDFCVVKYSLLTISPNSLRLKSLGTSAMSLLNNNLDVISGITKSGCDPGSALIRPEDIYHTGQRQHW